MAARPKNVLLLWTDQQRADTVGPDKDSPAPDAQFGHNPILSRRHTH